MSFSFNGRFCYIFSWLAAIVAVLSWNSMGPVFLMTSLRGCPQQVRHVGEDPHVDATQKTVSWNFSFIKLLAHIACKA